MQKHVDRRWHPPLGTKGKQAKVRITISKNGLISSGINIQSCSGSSEFFSSVREAFERSEPLPRPPTNYNLTKFDRTITFIMD